MAILEHPHVDPPTSQPTLAISLFFFPKFPLVRCYFSAVHWLYLSSCFFIYLFFYCWFAQSKWLILNNIGQIFSSVQTVRKAYLRWSLDSLIGFSKSNSNTKIQIDTYNNIYKRLGNNIYKNHLIGDDPICRCLRIDKNSR